MEKFSNISLRDLIVGFESLSGESESVARVRNISGKTLHRILRKLVAKFGQIAAVEGTQWISTSGSFYSILEDFHHIFSDSNYPLDKIKIRDLWVFSLLSRGYSVQEIAEQMQIQQPNISKSLSRFALDIDPPIVEKNGVGWELKDTSTEIQDSFSPLERLLAFFHERDSARPIQLRVACDPVLFDFFPNLWLSELTEREDIYSVQFEAISSLRSAATVLYDGIISTTQPKPTNYVRKLILSVKDWGLIYRKKNLAKSIYSYPIVYCHLPNKSLINRFEKKIRIPNLHPILEAVQTTAVVGLAPMEMCRAWQQQSHLKLEAALISSATLKWGIYWRPDSEKQVAIKALATRIANEIQQSFG